MFTATVTGSPNSSYYVWLTRTYTMTGEPGEQPPVTGSTSGIEQDPPDGPYTIGSYAFNNGGERTIRDDVVSSASGMSNTRYYAMVTTDDEVWP